MADEPILVGTPDGQRFQFPAGTDRLTMKRAIDEHYRSTAVGQGGAPSMPPEPPPEPSLGRQAWDALNTGVNWLGTRAIKAGAGMVEMAPDNPGPAAAARAATGRPTGGTGTGGDIVKNVFFKQLGAPEINAPGNGGKVLDAATEAVLAASAFPGGMASKWFPAAAGGASSELAGQQVAGTPYEIPVRVAAGLAGGAAAAGVQTAGGALVRGAKNVLAPASATEDTATRIVGRSIERDKLTPQEMLARMKNLGEDAMPVDAGGENVRGALRGSIAAPGQARTTVRNALADRSDNEGARVGASIDKNVSPKGLTQTVDDLIAARSKASGPAYEAAGVPRDPKLYAQAPVLEGPAVKALIADSPDVRAAMDAARRLPDYKGLPDTSMVMLDKAYKHIGGMADEAKRAGNGERFRDLDGLRKSLAAAIDAENSNYGVALKTYAEPSALKDAAELGAKLFSSNARPDAVRRDFTALSPDAQEAFRVGVAEQLRKTAGARDSTNVAGRVMGGPDAQARLTAVLGKDEAERIMADLAREKTFTRTSRDVGMGSRTTPMALEASDNANAAAGVVGDVARGRFGNALSRVTGRITEGRTESVNARVAEILTSVKSEDRVAFVKALEDSILKQRLASPRNAFRAGVAGPMTNSTNERR